MVTIVVSELVMFICFTVAGAGEVSVEPESKIITSM